MESSIFPRFPPSFLKSLPRYDGLSDECHRESLSAPNIIAILAGPKTKCDGLLPSFLGTTRRTPVQTSWTIGEALRATASLGVLLLRPLCELLIDEGCNLLPKINGPLSVDAAREGGRNDHADDGWYEEIAVHSKQNTQDSGVCCERGR